MRGMRGWSSPSLLPSFVLSARGDCASSEIVLPAWGRKARCHRGWLLHVGGGGRMGGWVTPRPPHSTPRFWQVLFMWGETPHTPLAFAHPPTLLLRPLATAYRKTQRPFGLRPLAAGCRKICLCGKQPCGQQRQAVAGRRRVVYPPHSKESRPHSAPFVPRHSIPPNPQGAPSP